MKKTRIHRWITAGIVAACLAGSYVSFKSLSAQQRSTAQIDIGSTDLGGIVTSPAGAEAGVWVIAETTDLPTKFAKAVVTDDLGRYVIPALPKATYNVWVRGYELVDFGSRVAQGSPVSCEYFGVGIAESVDGLIDVADTEETFADQVDQSPL